MSELAKAYEPKEVESKWYKSWLENKCFAGVVDPKREPFSIVIPPPNVTGVLHMGHLLNNTLQDILIRNARQHGKSAVWIPGTDHAGIATQSRVERELRKEGKTRHDLGREKFVETAAAWRDKHGGIILDQLKGLGVSCDWDRKVHTLDPDYSNAVLTAFAKLYERGYIYRGRRMVNWCPVSLTALSDEEVIMKPQKGKLYKMRYELADSPGQYLEIATTRPETIMGDTAVAVHPEDERYKHLIGKHVWRPFPRERIVIVGDAHVDRSFGTGVLKVTPAHDKADFEIGLRHKLPVVDVMNPDGTMNALAGPEFAGKDRFVARKMAEKKLEELGLLIAAEEYENNVGFSERADVPIEPRLSDQWFLKYPKVEESKTAVRDGIIKFYPERWSKTYLHWLENIQDWCISRQLWWGHRIPVWYRKGADRNDDANRHVSVQGPVDKENWEQEEDVLDTWASSWLWTFGTFGWPESAVESEKELKYWHPTSVLVTAPDIIFFWVARMIMASLELYGEAKKTLTHKEIEERIPFKNVYFNGLIRDEKGRKMSKSLGNSPEPLDLIAKFGADGLRLGLLLIAPQGQDILFSEERVQQGRNFCNKLWNACRFRQMNGSIEDQANATVDAIAARINPSQLDADDHAILGQLVATLDTVSKAIAEFEFNTAVQAIYSFFWNDLCDWYIEVSKTKLKDDTLKGTCLAIQDLCIRQTLLVLHPMTPFITEELWHQLGYGKDGSFIQNVSPEDGIALSTSLSKHKITPDVTAKAEIETVRDLVSKARALKAQYNLATKKDVKFLFTADPANRKIVKIHVQKISNMLGAQSFDYLDNAPDGLPATVAACGTIYLDLASAIDVDAEKQRIGKELEKLDKAIAAGESKLSNEKFVSSAPANIVEGAKKQLTETKAKRDELIRILENLK